MALRARLVRAYLLDHSSGRPPSTDRHRRAPLTFRPLSRQVSDDWNLADVEIIVFAAMPGRSNCDRAV
jgi:hypothetical protein